MMTDLCDVPAASVRAGFAPPGLGLEQLGEAQAPHRQPADLEERPPRQTVAVPLVPARSPQGQHDRSLPPEVGPASVG